MGYRHPNFRQIEDYLKSQLEDMFPSNFALAMATGIVAIVAYRLGLKELGLTLSWINIIVFPILWSLFLARVVMYPKNVLADCMSHQRAYGFFTSVAATSIVGSQLVVLHNLLFLGEILWWINVLLWLLCTYSIFTALTIRSEKPTLSEGINGGWLLAVVGTQSVCVLGCGLGATMLGNRDMTLFLLMSFWLCGGMLYLWIIALIFYRYMFFTFSPRDLMPPYWINMGAVAISSLAGALLTKAIKNSELLGHLHPFVLGLTIMFWATATWWIPMLVILGIWRHRIKRIPISYDPHYWGLVFPFGMYATCTYQLSQALSAPFLMWIAKFAMIAAASAWLLAFFGLAGRLLHTPLFACQRLHARNREEKLIPNTKGIGDIYGRQS
ncbi:MAG: tellurite resistance/C4-dicarboxylate transporter family protein [Bdellovibrio sp.]|nr:tellurite resistance/C4-dicarboxylate transporter family protein [Bdellovibrio sp.]